MAKISGWAFIVVGFIIIAISIFLYDTLKLFIVLGGFMTLYGLGKISYERFKDQFLPKDEEEGPVDLDKTQNPYLQPQQARPQQYAAVQGQQQAQQLAHQHTRQGTAAPARHYCSACGRQLHSGDRFCGSCGARIQ